MAKKKSAEQSQDDAADNANTQSPHTDATDGDGGSGRDTAPHRCSCHRAHGSPLCRKRWVVAVVFVVLAVILSTAPDKETQLLMRSTLTEYTSRLSLPHFGAGPRPGEQLRQQGLRAHHPVVMVPGIVSTGLELWQGEPCAAHHFRERMWGTSVMLRNILVNHRCWLKHMMLNLTNGKDPEGIKLRAATGLEAADYLLGGYWVWGKIIQNLADIGYDSNSMLLAAYDWRLALPELEQRDAYFTKLQQQIQTAKKTNLNRKVVLLVHSMGATVMNYFFKWVESDEGGQGGPTWVNDHIKSMVSIGGAWLGVPKAFSALLSGEMKDTAEMSQTLRYLVERVFSRLDMLKFLRSVRSLPYMLPRGGPAVWGTADVSPDDRTAPAVPGSTAHNNSNGTSPKAPAASAEKQGDYSARSPEEHERVPASVRTMGIMLSFTSATDGGSAALANVSADEQAKLRICPETRVIDPEALQHLSHREHPVDSALDVLRSVAPTYMGQVDREVSFGVGVKKGSRHWSNPLESELPRAPNLTVFCLYGVSQRSERAYYYRPHTYAPTAEEAVNVPFVINNSVTYEHAPYFVHSGVQFSDGDATVPLLSLGYMCTRGWKYRQLNPSRVRTVVREYEHSYRDPIGEAGKQRGLPAQCRADNAKAEDAAGAGVVGDDAEESVLQNFLNFDGLVRGGPKTADHVDILGNVELIADVLKIAGHFDAKPVEDNDAASNSSDKTPTAQGQGPVRWPTERVVSSIRDVSARVDIALAPLLGKTWD